MPVNKEELAKDLETDPSYIETVTKALAPKKIEVLNEQAKTALLNNHKREVIEKELPNEVKKIHDQYDNDLKTLFPTLNRDVSNNEKTYDFMKRAVTSTIADKDTKIKELDEAVKKGDVSGALTKRITDTEENAKKEIALRDLRIKELEQGTSAANKTAKFAEVFGDVKSKFMKQLPPLFSETEKMINADVLSRSVMKDGKLYAGNTDGTIKKNPSNFAEITVEDELNDRYKEVIDIKRVQGGAGSGSGEGSKGGIDPTTITKDNFPFDAGKIKTTEDLMTQMIEIGLARGSKQFNDIWNKYVDATTGKLRPM